MQRRMWPRMKASGWRPRRVASSIVAGLTTGAILLGAAHAVAEEKKYGPGETDTEIKLGQTAPFSGPASSFGATTRAIGNYFRMINASGGINGRRINLISLDDA